MSKGENRVCLGAFSGAHGVKGEALIKTFTERSENIASYGDVTSEDGKRSFSLKFIRETKPGLALVSAPEITSREDAQSLKGVRLYVPRAALPAPEADEFYMDDLVGLVATDETGKTAGTVTAVHNFGAGDLIELKKIPGVKGARLIPFTKDAVPDVNIDGGRIVVARAAIEIQDNPSISDETGEIVSDDIEVDLAAMQQEDS